jgi:hypothetical protein
MSDIRPEDMKATYETKNRNEANNYEELGWLLIDSYRVGQEEFFVLAWKEDGEPPRP